MQTKAFEIRDRATFIPVIATLMESENEQEHYLLRRSGFGAFCGLVVLCRMEASGVDRNATYDPFAWGMNARTYNIAHRYIAQNWHNLNTGQVIDVEFILGETTIEKISEIMDDLPY